MMNWVIFPVFDMGWHVDEVRFVDSIYRRVEFVVGTFHHLGD